MQNTVAIQPEEQRRATPGERRRGRPVGRNRMPLNINERRQRNAQYERERRAEAADAVRDLAAAIGEEVDSNLSQAEIIARAMIFIANMTEKKRKENEELAREKEKLNRRITNLRKEREKHVKQDIPDA